MSEWALKNPAVTPGVFHCGIPPLLVAKFMLDYLVVTDDNAAQISAAILNHEGAGSISTVELLENAAFAAYRKTDLREDGF